MFGEESIYGQNEVSLDSKKRIILPANTKREKGDTLLLVKDHDISLYEIFNAYTYDKLIEDLNQKIANTTDKQEEIYYKKKIYEISKSIIKKLNVDVQGRVTLGNIYEKENTNKILCIGAYDRLILKPIEGTTRKI